MQLNKSGLNKVVSIFVTEYRILRRLPRFWMIALLLTLISQVSYVLACWYLAYHLPYDPTAGMNAPKYLLSNIDPTIFLFFQWASLILLFDLAHRHKRNRIDEVMDTTPITNLEVLVGRTLAVAGIVWFIGLFNISIMQVIGCFSYFGWHYAETLQWHSIVNLVLVDAPVNLIFWCSVLILLGVVLRTRILVVLVGSAAMFGWYWLVIRSPYSMLSLVSPSSNDTIFISELIPSFLSFNTFVVRVSYVLFAAFFLICATLLKNRMDGSKTRIFNLGLLLTSLTCGIGVFIWGFWGLLTPVSQFEQWKAVHAQYEWVDDVDIQRISGDLHIVANKILDAKFVISIVKNSGSSTKPLVFTLNPGLRIQKLEIRGSPVDYNFDNGLLEIQTTNVEIGIPIELIINARGKPTPNFAYLDSAVDYLSDGDVSVTSAKLLGKDGSVFNSSYIALMPGIHWYPTPGPMNAENRKSQTVRDFFAVELNVTLEPAAWNLIASASVSQSATTPNTYSVRSSAQVPEIGLFASRFQHSTIEVGGVRFSMFLHVNHTENLHPITDWNDTLRETVEWWIEECHRVGLTFPVETMTFVEVPRSLRTVGGGWRMDAVDTLPNGLVLLKEHGYPRANLQLATDRYIKRVKSWGPEFEEVSNLAPLRLLTLYFDRGKGTDAPWSSLNKHLWTHHTTPSGAYASTIDQIVNWLVASLPSELHRPKRQFSIYSTLRVADFTNLQFVAARRGLDDVQSNPNIVHREYESDTVRLERTFVERFSIWNHIEENGISRATKPMRSRRELEALLLKTREIASGLRDVNDQEKIFRWIHELRNQYHARNFTYQDFINSAKKHEIKYEPFLTEWITKNTIPAYRVREHKIRQMADDERGNTQYQTTVVLENTKSVAGYVKLMIPTEETAEWSLPYFDDEHSIEIHGNTTLRVRLTTAYKIAGFKLNPGLSYNRESLYFELHEQIGSLEPIQTSSPFIEVVDSYPKDGSIIVDDLDGGFQVHQRTPHLKPSRKFGPFAWLSDQHTEVVLDENLPLQTGFGLSRSLPNYWHRQTQNLMLAPFGHRDSPVVEFKTTIPADGEWQLNYHYPWVVPIEWRNESEIPDDDTLSIVISQSEQTYEAPLDIKPMSYGWNIVGKFELKSDPVSVKIVYRPKSHSDSVRIYADAIRWTPID